MDELNTASNAVPSEPASAPAAEPSVSQQPSSPPSTREALDRAFDSVFKEGDEPQQQPARARDPITGKFAGQAPAVKPAVAPQPNTAQALQAEQDAAKAAQISQTVEHPGLSKEALALWATAPEALRADIMRRTTELTRGIEQYKGELEQTKKTYEPINRYMEMAQQSGRTLDAVLADYTGIENMLHQNPVQGIMQICQNLGLNTQALAQALVGMPPQQPLQQQQQPPQTPAELKRLEERLDRFEQEQKFKTFEQQVNDFANARSADGMPEHPYFVELADSISEMLETKFARNLLDAYEKAVRLNPEIAERIAQDRAAKAAPPTQPDPAQTRDKARKSVTGSPSSASNAATRKPAGSPREALDNAFASLGLG